MTSLFPSNITLPFASCPQHRSTEHNHAVLSIPSPALSVLFFKISLPNYSDDVTFAFIFDLFHKISQTKRTNIIERSKILNEIKMHSYILVTCDGTWNGNYQKFTLCSIPLSPKILCTAIGAPIILVRIPSPFPRLLQKTSGISDAKLSLFREELIHPTAVEWLRERFELTSIYCSTAFSSILGRSVLFFQVKQLTTASTFVSYFLSICECPTPCTPVDL